jgi:hypothetical protein
MHRALLALLAAAGLFAQKLPFDAQALLDLARIGDPQVSPDGRMVAFHNSSRPIDVFPTTRPKDHADLRDAGRGRRGAADHAGRAG